MCTHSRFIFNPYSRKNVLVKCGKCPSCLQEKAFARAQRIKNNYSDGTICLFFTLTYSNDFIPYIDRDDVYEASLFPTRFTRMSVKDQTNRRITIDI